MCILLVVEGQIYPDKALFHIRDLFLNFSYTAAMHVMNRKELILDMRVM